MPEPPRAAPHSERFTPGPHDHRFFTAMAVAAAAVTFLGFGWSYGPKVWALDASVPAVIHVHAGVFSCWLLLSVAQARLVSARRIAAHRRLGLAGAVLAGLMLVLGVWAAVTAARLGHRGLRGAEFPDAEGFLLFSLLAILAFTALAGAALYFRRKPQTHKRLMLFATVGALMPPGISRLPGVGSHLPAIAALSVLFLLAGPAYDLATRRRVHPAYLWGLLPVTLTLPPLVRALAASAPWHLVASWLMR